MYFSVRNTYIRTSHCVPTTIVRTLERKNKTQKKEKKNKRRKLKTGKTTRKQTYQNYLYIQSANFDMLFSCAVYALCCWLECRKKVLNGGQALGFEPVPRGPKLNWARYCIALQNLANI